MVSTTTAKSLALIPQLLLGALLGIFAGAISGGLAGGLLLTGFGILGDLTTPNSGQNYPLAKVVEAFKEAFALGAFFGFPSAAAIGGLFGLYDGFYDGRLAHSINGKLEWIFTGAPLGSIGGAILLGLLLSVGDTEPVSGMGIGIGAMFGLPAGAIAGPIFGFIYKRLTPSSAVMKLATANRDEP